MPGLRRRAVDGARCAQRRHPAAGRFRAQRDLPVLRAAINAEAVEKIILTASGGPFRTAVAGRDGAGDAGRRRSRIQLDHGRQDLGRFGDHDEQGPRADRGPPPVRPAGRSRSRSWSIRSRSSTAWSPIATARCWRSSAARHAHADRLCARLAERHRSAGRAPRPGKIGQLTFEAPDPDRFPALRMAREALRGGRRRPTVLNAANEVAVAAFLGRPRSASSTSPRICRARAERTARRPASAASTEVSGARCARPGACSGMRSLRAAAMPLSCVATAEHSGPRPSWNTVWPAFRSYVVPFLVVLTVLVFVHELGHYLVARRNGVRVEVFSIGFGPELFGWTDRSRHALEVQRDPARRLCQDVRRCRAASLPWSRACKAMTPEEREVSFHHKRLGQRAAIVAAGPFANFIFAIVVLLALFMTSGKPFHAGRVGGVEPAAPQSRRACSRATGSSRSTASTIERFEDIAADRAASIPARPWPWSFERDGHGR